MNDRHVLKNSQPFFFFFLFTLLLSTQTFAAESKHYRFTGFDDEQMGLGLFVGDPIAVQLKYFTNWKRAFNFYMGYGSAKTIQFGTDYIFYGYNAQDKVINVDFWNSLIFYGGGGVLSGFGLSGSDPNDAFQFAVRVLGGIEYIFVGSPWSVRMEAAPEFFLKGKNPVGLSLGLGITYYWWDGAGKKAGETKVRETRTQQIQQSQQIDESEFDSSDNPKPTPTPRPAVKKSGTRPPARKPAPNPGGSQSSEFDEFK